MKMGAKRIISVLLSLVIVFAVCPLASAEKETLACGHSDYKVTIDEKKATCVDYGYSEQRECETCSYVQKAKYIEATGHEYKLDESSRNADGAVYKCVKCGDSYFMQHRNWSYLLIEKKPTCTDSGYSAERICKDCGYHQYSEYLPAENHSLKVVATDAVKHTVECKKCSYKATSENHKAVFVYDGDYSCYVKQATGKMKCSECGYILEDNIMINGDEHRNTTVKNEGFYSLEICDDCGDVAVKPGSCTACRDALTKGEYTVKQPACGVPGYFTYSCSCGSQGKATFDALDHYLTEYYVTTQEATCQQPGIKSRLCLRCDYTSDLVLSKTAHKYIVLSPGVPVDCEVDGISDEGYCVYCFEIAEHAVIPATGHNLIDYNGEQFCTRCYKYMIDTEAGTIACKCLCHNHDGLSQTIFKFILKIVKLFGIMQSCDCGAVHYEKKVKTDK